MQWQQNKIEWIIISVLPNVDAIMACKLGVTEVPSGFQVGIPTLGAFFDEVADWDLWSPTSEF